MNKRASLEKRLSSYWKMEVANAALLPAVMVYFAAIFKSSIGPLSLITFIPMVCLLIIGGLYWRAKLSFIKGRAGPLKRVIKVANYTRIPMLILTVFSIILVTLSWANLTLSSGLGDRIVATIAITLAALEYINYYHFQLQHFDHVEDMRRLVTGRGFRPSQMSVDLKKWRRSQRS